MITCCGKCGGQIDIQQKDLKTRSIVDDIEELYFNCPKCDEEFIIMRTNEHIRKLGEKFKQAKEKIFKIDDTNLRSEQIKLMQRHQKDYKKALDKFNNKVR